MPACLGDPLFAPQVDPVVFNMLQEDPGKVDYSSIGGLSEQVGADAAGGTPAIY